MAKIVCYNGGKESFYGCSNPYNLIKGKTYEVISSKDRGWQTDYTLKGVDGEFNSSWFDEIFPQFYMAISREIPKINERHFCYKIDFANGKHRLVPWLTSSVNEVFYIGNNIYQVTTCNNIYVVTVGNL